MIVMQGCPYCAAAKRAIKELKAEQAAYAPLTVEEIEDGSAAAGVWERLLLCAERLHRGGEVLRGPARPVR